MLAIDTDVLVRLLVDDEPEQSQAARRLVEQQEILLCSTVLLEAEWVLRSGYGLPKAKVLEALAAVCGLPHVVLAEPDRIASALAWAAGGLDFADSLHLAAAAGCEAFVTFDRELARAAAKAGGAPTTRLIS